MSRSFPQALYVLILSILFSLPASATSYYVAANGSDSNNGTSESTPWLHAPGMPNCSGTCASTTPRAGDKVIFRGGDTWHFGNSSATPYAGGTWNFSQSGSAGNLIYLGVDKTWYAGSSWVRPALTGDNPVFNGTSFPSSCAHDFGSPSVKSIASLGSYVQFDNFEITGVCWSTAISGNPGIVNTGSNDLITNDWWHGWTMTSSADDKLGMTANSSNVTFDHDIFDGSDAPHFPAGNSNCSNGTSCTTGIAMYPRCSVVENSVFHYIRVVGVCTDAQLVHDNTFEYQASAPSGNFEGNQHDDAIMYYHGSSSASGVFMLFYNNVIRHNWIDEQFYSGVSGGSSAWMFNNVFYDNHSAIPENCWNLNAQSSGTQTLYVVNNTFDNDTDNSSGLSNGCVISLYGNESGYGNSFGIGWNGPINAANNHLIGYSNLASLFGGRGGTYTYTVNDLGGNVIQSTSAARAQGYTQSESPVADRPLPNCTPSTCATLGAGVNESSLCSQASSDNELCSGTTGAASDSAGILTYPTLTVVQRSGTWDSGAFQYTASGAAPNPPTGLAAVVQ